MYRKIEDFIKDWKNETDETLKLFSTLTDDSLGVKVYPEGRDLGYITWHIVISISEMANKTGLTVQGPDEHSDYPKSASEICKAFEETANSLLDEVTKKWTDATLEEEVDMYGEIWKKGLTLWILVKHQIHHRGQVTVLMRQATLKVHGVCGPSKEEWQNYGAPAAR